MKKNLMGWILSAIVLLLLFVVGMILKDPVRLYTTGERTEGIVVGMAMSPGSAGQDSLKSPIVEFVTLTGERVSVKSRASSAGSPSACMGETVTVAYNPSYPRDAQLFLLKDFGIVGFFLGFIAFIILIWMTGILVTGDPALDDPFRLLPAFLFRVRLNPFRFPLLLMLSILIPVCGVGTYVLSKEALSHRNDIKAVGHVVGFQSKKESSNRLSSTYPEIAFEDLSGKAHTILGLAAGRGLLAFPLKTGDAVNVCYPALNPDKGIENSWVKYLGSFFFGFCTIAFLALLGLTLRGYIEPRTSEWRSRKKIKTSGVLAVATVIEANRKTRTLFYRVDRETNIAVPNPDDFNSFEVTLSFWIPSKADAGIKKGDKFRAYMDSQQPSKDYYVDFNDKIGANSSVRSLAEENESFEKEEEEIADKLRSLATTSSAYLLVETLTEIQKLIDEDECHLAFEKLMTNIMNLPRPLPAPIQSIDWKDCLKLGVDLGLNQKAGANPKFWKEFRAFMKEFH